MTGVLQSLLDESTGQVIVSPFGVFGMPHDKSLPVVGLASNIEDTPEVHWERSDFLDADGIHQGRSEAVEADRQKDYGLYSRCRQDAANPEHEVHIAII